MEGIFDMSIFANFKTSEGSFKVQLFDEQAPNTVANFVGLVEGSKSWTDPTTRQPSSTPFYDGLTFHRVIDGFMIQGGCPLGTGTGGPGYTFEDEFNDHKVVRGAIAMANAGPNTNGSQFFIVTIPAADWLDGKHTVFGEVVEGMEAVDAIEATATDARDMPLEPQVIESVELS